MREGGGVWGHSHMYMHWWAGERLACETSYLHSTAQPGGGAAVFLHCAYTTSDDAFVHSIVVNSPRQCRSGTVTNGATENAAGFNESLRNCSFGGCTRRRPLTRACKCTCVHKGKQPRLEQHVCDLCSPSLLLLPCFW